MVDLSIVDGFSLADLPSGGWGSIQHVDVGPELTRSEWEALRSHKLAEGISFPGLPHPGDIFRRIDERKSYTYSRAGWGGLTIVPATLVVAAYNSNDKAKADYICDGIDDQVTINAAIDALPTSGGRVILLEGDYSISQSGILAGGQKVGININRNDMILSGQGSGTILKMADGENLNGGVIGGNNPLNLIVENLQVDGNETNNPTSGYGMFFGPLSPNMRNSIIKNCWVKDCKTEGARISGSNIVLSGCIISGCYRGAEITKSGLEINTVVNCSFLDNDDIGLFLQYHVAAVGNLAKGNGKVANNHGGIILGDAAKGCLVDGNLCVDNYTGIWALSYGYGNIISNNVCESNRTTGIYIVGGVDPELEPADRNTIIGNLCKNNSQAAADNYDGILIDLARGGNIVIGNVCFDDQETRTQRNGIRIEDATSVGNYIIGNYLRDHTSANLVDLGTGTVIKYNRGHVTENSGTVILPTGATSVSVAHGLASTPTVVTLGAKHSEVADAVWGANTTNITITAPAAVTGNREISWRADTTGKVIGIVIALTDAYSLADALTKNI